MMIWDNMSRNGLRVRIYTSSLSYSPVSLTCQLASEKTADKSAKQICETNASKLVGSIGESETSKISTKEGIQSGCLCCFLTFQRANQIPERSDEGTKLMCGLDFQSLLLNEVVTWWLLQLFRGK